MIRLAAVLLAAAQQSEEDRLQRAEEKRIAAKTILSEKERESYRRPRFRRPRDRRTAFSLAIIPVSFSDKKTAVSMESVFEQAARHLERQSAGRLTLARKTYPAVEIQETRAEFGRLGLRSDGEGEALRKVVEKWLARNGAGLTAAHDGAAFVMAGALGARNSALWPHQGALVYGGGTIPYLVIPVELGRHAVGIVAHECGHLLGLPDKYEVGRHCLMGMGYDRPIPAPLCGWCRHRLGWTSPGIDRAEESGKVRLLPGEVLNVLVTPDGKESLFLEARRRGVLAWHQVQDRHPSFLVALPTPASDRLTPYSKPSFLGTTVGAREVWITDVRWEKGRAYLSVGPTADLTPLEAYRKRNIGRRIGD